MTAGGHGPRGLQPAEKLLKGVVSLKKQQNAHARKNCCEHPLRGQRSAFGATQEL
jgi:hypothetical protein